MRESLLSLPATAVENILIRISGGISSLQALSLSILLLWLLLWLWAVLDTVRRWELPSLPKAFFSSLFWLLLAVPLVLALEDWTCFCETFLFLLQVPFPFNLVFEFDDLEPFTGLLLENKTKMYVNVTTKQSKNVHEGRGNRVLMKLED